MWAQLLKLVYGREVESDALFFQHAFLVIVAKAIALAVLGLRDDNPRHVLSGAAFEAAGIFGAAESDFFDWVVAEAEGEALVRRILVHVRRFRLDQVETDVLKILYESLIDREERHGLGEYYTPDWLAKKVVRHAVERPIEQRVLDPACGSGTFLFHAIRNFINDAEEAGLDERLRAEEATNHIAGMDIHPVAVIIARVTYLLALAPVIAKRAGSLSIPVYLGDALQLSTATTMHLKELVIRVPPPPEGTDLKFPEIFCKDIHLFDKLVARMRQGSEQKMTARQIEQAFRLEVERHYKRDMTNLEAEGVGEMVATYATFDELCRQGRDSVWTYVARNLSRPLALSFGAGWANVVVGNPPWVAFRHMSADLQKRFRDLANGERVYVGGKFATQNDLSALFTVRSASLYLRSGGRIAFVLPLAALTRGQFDKFRKGAFSSARIAWDESWTMNDDVQSRRIGGTGRCGAGDARERAEARRRSVHRRLGLSEIIPSGGDARSPHAVFGGAKKLGPTGRGPDGAFRRQPPQQPGKAALEVAPRSGASGRDRISAPGAFGRKHPTLSRLAAVRGRRAGYGPRNSAGRGGCGKSWLLWHARLDDGCGGCVECAQTVRNLFNAAI